MRAAKRVMSDVVKPSFFSLLYKLNNTPKIHSATSFDNSGTLTFKLMPRSNETAVRENAERLHFPQLANIIKAHDERMRELSTLGVASPCIFITSNGSAENVEKGLTKAHTEVDSKQNENFNTHTRQNIVGADEYITKDTPFTGPENKRKQVCKKEEAEFNWKFLRDINKRWKIDHNKKAIISMTHIGDKPDVDGKFPMELMKQHKEQGYEFDLGVGYRYFSLEDCLKEAVKKYQTDLSEAPKNAEALDKFNTLNDLEKYQHEEVYKIAQEIANGKMSNILDGIYNIAQAKFKVFKKKQKQKSTVSSLPCMG